MKVRAAMLPLVVLALAIPASADHVPNPKGCPVHVTETGPAKPNAADPANDWDGAVTGNGAATVPSGDLYREGTDIRATWLHRDGDDLTAHVQVANLALAQPNSIFYVLWDYVGARSAETRRFVSARLKGYAVGFTYGYYTINPVTGDNLYRTEGDTTGSIIPGENGEIVIDVPKGGTTLAGFSNDDWGKPAIGAQLKNVQARSSILAGSPEALPPNPSGFRHGFVYDADTTEDGTGFCDAYVNAEEAP